MTLYGIMHRHIPTYKQSEDSLNNYSKVFYGNMSPYYYIF